MTLDDYDPEFYKTKGWFESLDHTDQWYERALYAVLAILGVPESFLDVGCGNGRLVRLMALRLPEDGAVAGIELARDPRRPFMTLVREADLREMVVMGQLYDLVISWEVGEHLPEEDADMLVENIARHIAPGGWLVFTAAHSGQGGDNHINEQPPIYWKTKLEAQGLTSNHKEAALLEFFWETASGPCEWLWQNLQVFRRDGD